MTYRINGIEVTKEEWLAYDMGAEPIIGGTPDSPGKGPCLMGANSFNGFVSPVDGSYIDSKHKLNEHNARNDVVQVGNDLINKGCEGRTRQESIDRQKS